MASERSRAEKLSDLTGVFVLVGLFFLCLLIEA